MDRVADRSLRREFALSYRRFLVLFMVSELGAGTQRALADRLEISEPSVSRMTGVLADIGLLDVDAAPTGGHRRSLRLTPEGQKLMERCRDHLAAQFAEVVERSGVPADAYSRHTRRLLDTLDSGTAPPHRSADPASGRAERQQGKARA